MADIKFSCPHCGQHVTADEQWSGHQIQCPSCAAGFIVPQALSPPPAAAPVGKAPSTQPAAAQGPRLAPGATQVRRPNTPGTIPKRQLPRPPGAKNPLLKYAVNTLVLAVLGGIGYLIVPSIVSKVQDATKDISNSKPNENAPASSSGGGGGAGPMGEVNGAMDVSDTLDGGGSSSRPRPAPARQPVAAQTPAPPPMPPAPSPVKTTNDVSRAKQKRPR